MTDTIVAQATPPGRGGIGVIRISGPLVKKIAENLLKKIPQPRYAHYSAFFDQNNTVVDQGIALFFPAPNSFTGEDVLELQGHSGSAVIDSVLKIILQNGARFANPGEFSERAFLNGKIDLTQAEAIADLIDANSAQAAKYAVRSLQGEFSKQINQLLEQVISIRMYIEAAIDFPDEEIDFLSDGKINHQLIKISQQLEKILNTAQQGSILAEGLKIVITGKPNVGKSSLLNRLSGDDIAIVTDIPGTTRDVLRQHILIDGIPINIVDTAGLHSTNDEVERQGINRAINEINAADCLLIITDITEQISDEDVLNSMKEFYTGFENKNIIIIRNKLDLIDFNPDPAIKSRDDNIKVINLSAKTGEGVERLLQELKKLIGLETTTEGQFIARRRHVHALQQAKNYLLNAQIQLTEFAAAELVAEELLQVQNELSKITGKFHNEDLLDKIFKSFCIGK